MNVVGYIRVSSKGQMEGDGPKRQEFAIENFCIAHKLRLDSVFTEEGVSGTVDGMDREAFSKMIELIVLNNEALTPDHPRYVVAVVVERLDRLARDLMVSEVLLKELRSRGIKVFATDQGALIDMATDDGDPTRKLIRQILGALAEWEKSHLVLKLRLARERKKRQGFRMCGGTPYGKTATERTIIGLIKQWRSQQFTFERIAEFLNAGGFHTRTGGTWRKSGVIGIYKFNINNQKKETK